jgi:hypothetical protein
MVMQTDAEHRITQIEGIKVDMSTWPVLAIIPEDNLTDEAILEFIEVYSQVTRTKSERFATLMDLRKCANLPTRQRKILTDGMKQNKEFNKHYCVGAAMVFDSAVIRGVLMAVFWLVKPDHPTKVFKTYEEAMSWVQSQF